MAMNCNYVANFYLLQVHPKNKMTLSHIHKNEYKLITST